MPFSPVQKARKFSAVFGATCPTRTRALSERLLCQCRCGSLKGTCAASSTPRNRRCITERAKRPQATAHNGLRKLAGAERTSVRSSIMIRPAGASPTEMSRNTFGSSITKLFHARHYQRCCWRSMRLQTVNHEQSMAPVTRGQENV